MYKILILFLLFSSNLEAKIFRNSYVNFEIAKGWSCKIENTSWICVKAKKHKGANTAVIILTAKEKGPEDSLSLYEAHLKKPVKLNGVLSKVLNVSQRKINHHLWIDSLHRGSESVNFWTRYLASTHGNIAILVTFSSHKDFYTKYSNTFIKSIHSLRLSKQNTSSFGKNLRGRHESLGAPISGLLSSQINIPDEPVFSKKKGNSTGKILGLLFLLLAGGLIWYKKRNT